MFIVICLERNVKYEMFIVKNFLPRATPDVAGWVSARKIATAKEGVA